jgi:delta 1-pyrroline-5-carboxylate dehydrogenase
MYLFTVLSVVERLREYIDEIKSDVCTLTQGVVSRIQETMNVDTLGVNPFSYRY